MTPSKKILIWSLLAAFTALAAIAVLKDKPYYRKLGQKINAQRSILYKSFKVMGLNYVDSCTNFILLKIPGRAVSVSRKLLDKGVIVRDMSFWGMNNYIRVTIGTAQENKRFVKTLKEIL